jgi:hypothetical protein
MDKSSHFSGQPLYCWVINLLGKSKILQISRERGGERYVKSFNGWSHFVVMLYAVIMRFDSLREIATSMPAEARKLCHLGIGTMPVRWPMPTNVAQKRYSRIYTVIYTPDTVIVFARTAENRNTPKWMRRLQIIDMAKMPTLSRYKYR